MVRLQVVFCSVLLIFFLPGRNKPLAPTCNVCLIRDDRTTIWCEVTSSIRTRVEEISDEENNQSVKAAGSKGSKTSSSDEDKEKATTKQQGGKELLLCLRPVRDGDDKVEEALRFVPHSELVMGPLSIDAIPAKKAKISVPVAPSKTISGSTDPSNDAAAPVSSSGSLMKRPPKKRPPTSQDSSDTLTAGSSNESGGSNVKRIHTENEKKASTSACDTEQSAVESLMLMSNKSK